MSKKYEGLTNEQKRAIANQWSLERCIKKGKNHIKDAITYGERFGVKIDKHVLMKNNKQIDSAKRELTFGEDR